MPDINKRYPTKNKKIDFIKQKNNQILVFPGIRGKIRESYFYYLSGLENQKKPCLVPKPGPIFNMLSFKTTKNILLCQFAPHVILTKIKTIIT